MSIAIRLIILAGFTVALPCLAAKLQTTGSSSFSLLGSQYISSSQPYFSNKAESSSGDFEFELNQDFSFGDRYKAKVQAKDTWASTENWNYVDLNQAFVQYRLSSRTDFSLGRQLHKWSFEDEEWQQGIFQPRYRQNKMRAEAAGLTGLFAAQGFKDAKVTLGFLPINIPEFGPRFSLSEQKFVSKNPWFRPPPAQFRFRGRDGDIQYELDRPSNSEVLLNPGFAGKVEWARAKYNGRLSYAYKPMTGFLLGFPSENRVVVSQTADTMQLLVIPRIIYHEVTSLDSEWKAREWILRNNLTYEAPERYSSPSDWTTQEARPAFITTLAALRYLETPGPGATAVKFGFFRLWGGDTEDQGVFRGETSLFERRYQFGEAYSISLLKEFRGIYGKRLGTETRLIYDRLQEGMMMSFTSALALDKNWSAEFQFDLIGLTGAAAEIRDGFMALYRANDRVGLGMSYVF